MIYIFIKASTRNTGLGRYAKGISAGEGATVVYTEDFYELAGSVLNGDIGIFAGWAPIALNSMLSRFRKTYYVFTSPMGQMDLSSPDFYSAETAILMELLQWRQQGRLTNVIVTSSQLAARFDFVCLPAVLFPSTVHSLYSDDRYGYSFVGNNLRKHKNLVNTLAAISYLPPETIYVNQAQWYDNYARIFKCSFSSCSAPDDEQFQKLMSTHKIAFQCSYSESFNYLALEYALHGVPCVVSPCIEWYPLQNCVVSNIDDWTEIYQVARGILDDKVLYDELCQTLPEGAKMVNKLNIEMMKERVAGL